MASIFRPSTFNKLKPLLQAKATAFGTFRPKSLMGLLPPTLLPMAGASRMAHVKALRQPIRNQTHVSTTLAAHLLSKNPDSNIVFSPLSIHAALSLLAEGTKGQTHNQLLDFLKTSTRNDLSSLYSQHVSSILADGSPKGGPRLSFASGVWVDKTLSIKSPFKQVVDNVYKAACEHVDFLNKAGEVRKEVNTWVEKHTNNLIKELLPNGAVTNLTRLIFANAIYFKGAWRKKFDRSKTNKSFFHLLNGKKVQVPFMTSKEDQFVREYDNFKVLGLPYSRGKDKRQFTMYFYLPNAKDGLKSLVEKMGSTSNFLDNHIPYQEVKVGRFLIPKFKMGFGFEASNILQELGLVLPFNSKDGLTEIADSSLGEKLDVSSIYHKALVEVNEEGTEAAAVTAMVVIGSARRVQIPKRVDFVADHPFMFVIREDVTGAVLFMGQVTNPSATSD
ncbi:putative Serpin family protein [Helianthus annuus]|nr:putative Serpin family protein [Helianthus annuus]